MSTSYLIAGLAIVAPFVSAITVPGGSNPTAGSINAPWSASKVTAGAKFTIQWTTQTEGCGNTVDLVLLKGPSSSQMSAISYISQGVENSGSYDWTPSTDLEASTTDYGLEMICVSTQAYQYSTRFGIANDNQTPSDAYGSSSSSSSASYASSTAAAGYGSPYGTGYGSSTSTSAASSSSTSASASKSSEIPKYPVGSATGGLGYGANGTLPYATGSVTVPASLQTTTTAAGASSTGKATTTKSAASSSVSPAVTGAAGHVQASFGALVAGAAFAAFAL